jgi:sensor c-di-GMP phosphodiesterase-like protein
MPRALPARVIVSPASRRNDITRNSRCPKLYAIALIRHCSWWVGQTNIDLGTMRTHPQRLMVGLLATLLGVSIGALAGYWAGRELTLRQAEIRLDQYSRRNQVEGDATSAEARSVLAIMNASTSAFCSEPEIASFRRLVYESRYLKEAGRIRDGRIACSTTLGRDIAQVRVAPDFTQRDGTLIYRNLPMFRAGNETVIAVQLGDSYIVYSPFLPPVPAWSTIHYIATDMDAPTRMTGRLIGDVPNLPVSVLTREGRARIGNNMYDTRCSSDGIVCDTSYMTVSDALHTNLPAQLALLTMGSIAGGLLGFLCSLVYRLKKGLHHQLLRAIRNDTLRVVYQPIVDLATGKIVEAEALVRWTDDDNNLVTPDIFVKVAEERGFVGEITRLVVRRVLRDFGRTMRDRPGFRVNINIAAPDLADSEFLPMLERALAEAGVQPQSLGIEITESYTARQQVAKETILRLRQRGHYVHIDDFGTGYSSLAYLHDLSVDAIKIDKAFTKAIGTDAVTVSILPQILTMASTLGLRVVVEGIETPEQARYFAKANQSIYAQGWLFGRPVPREAFHQLLYADAPKQDKFAMFGDKKQVTATVSAA